MSQASQLSPELSRGMLQLARAIVAAARSWSLYPPEHPAIGETLSRLAGAIHDATGGAILAVAVTPETLFVEGAPADATQQAIAEAAALLHDRDILQLTFIGDAPPDALRRLVRMLNVDASERRRRGGPAQMWAAEGHPAIAIEQVDYKRVIEREETEGAEPARRDDLWRSIVLSIVAGERSAFNEQTEQRLLAIAGSVPDIGDLATAVMAPKCAMDGSPMITTQAAAVFAAFRHLASIATVRAPDRIADVMGNIAAAAARLDAHVVMELMRTADDPTDEVGIIRGMTGAFDDGKVAQLLATALALDHQASDRLATIFNTIAPDEDRKRRVLTLTRNLLSETDFGRGGQFQTLWTSMEELLIAYNDKPFVSDAYRSALDGVGRRAEKMAATELPPEMPEWLASLGQENVRSLSVALLIDLLTIERDASRAAEIANDMEALSEDLLMSGSYGDTRAVTTALGDRASAPGGIGRDACRHALDRLGESLALCETAALLGEVEAADWSAIGAIVRTVGPASIEALKPAVAVEHPTAACARAEELISGFGAAAVSRLASLVGDSRWYAQQAGARLLGRTRSAAAVPLLQPLLRKADPRVAKEAIIALRLIDDPSAARAVHTVLRAATGDLRRVIVETLVADRDPRVVPMLTRIIDESEPLGKDHEVVLDAVSALGTVGSDQAIPTLVALIRLRKFLGGKKLRGIKSRGVEALARIGSPLAAGAISEAAQTGDRALKKILAAKGTAA